MMLASACAAAPPVAKQASRHPPLAGREESYPQLRSWRVRASRMRFSFAPAACSLAMPRALQCRAIGAVLQRSSARDSRLRPPHAPCRVGLVSFSTRSHERPRTPTIRAAPHSFWRWRAGTQNGLRNATKIARTRLMRWRAAYATRWRARLQFEESQQNFVHPVVWGGSYGCEEENRCEGRWQEEGGEEEEVTTSASSELQTPSGATSAAFLFGPPAAAHGEAEKRSWPAPHPVRRDACYKRSVVPAHAAWRKRSENCGGGLLLNLNRGTLAFGILAGCYLASTSSQLAAASSLWVRFA